MQPPRGPASTSRNRAGSSENPPTLNGTTAFSGGKASPHDIRHGGGTRGFNEQIAFSMSCCRPSTGNVSELQRAPLGVRRGARKKPAETVGRQLFHGYAGR